MTYEYPWYTMFALMILAGVVIYAVCRIADWALYRLLDAMSARRDRKTALETETAEVFAPLTRWAAAQKNRRPRG